jgi:hypothetical protein
MNYSFRKWVRELAVTDGWREKIALVSLTLKILGSPRTPTRRRKELTTDCTDITDKKEGQTAIKSLSSVVLFFSLLCALCVSAVNNPG